MLWFFLISAVWAVQFPSMREANRTEVLKYIVDQFATSSAMLKTVLPACAEAHNATAFYKFTGSDHTVYLQSIDGVSLRDISELWGQEGQEGNERVEKADAFMRCIWDNGADCLFASSESTLKYDEEYDEVMDDTPESWAKAAEGAAESFFRMQQVVNDHHPDYYHPEACIPCESEPL